MPPAQDNYSKSSEALIVYLASAGDRNAFSELVRRRQSWLRNLMGRCCGDPVLADDLAQQAFLQAWRKISHLRKADSFGAWLKRLAITAWLQHLRKNDPLRGADEHGDSEYAHRDTTDIAMDLDRALAALSHPVRLCVVLSYHEGMPHQEIADLTGLPVGTVKSHIRRGSERLRELLSAYEDTSCPKDPK